MMKKNLFITFPVDAGMKASEESYKKLFEKNFDFKSFSYKKKNEDIYNKNIRKKRYRLLASIQLKNNIKKYSKLNKKIIFHGLSPMIYSFGSYNFDNTILCLDASRALPDFVINKTPKKDLAYHLHKFILKRVSKILCWTEPVIEMVNTFYNISDKKLFKVPPPFLFSEFKNFPKTTPSKPRVLFIGREFVRKGGNIILKNLHKFINNCKLTMVTADNKANIDNIKYFDAKLNKNQIFDLYNSNDILILPSQFDPYGLVLAEAASAGLAVITTKFALGSKDIVINNKTGFIAENQEECINRLVELIKDPKKIDDFKIAAYKKMELEFSESKIYNEYVKIINN